MRCDPAEINGAGNKGNYEGIILESEVFKILQRTLERSGVQDTVVISGWNDKTPNAEKEFDFLIISLPLKAIIHIEVKKTLRKESKESARNQLNAGHSTISSNVPFQRSSNWTYIQFICFSQEKGKHKSQDKDANGQSPVTGDPYNQFQEWWKSLSSNRLHKNQASKDDTKTYLDILKYLFHQMFIQEDVLTQGNFFYK